MLRRTMILAGMLVVGCGGAPPPDAREPSPELSEPSETAAAAAAEPAGPTRAKKCIEAANAEIAKPIAIPSDITVSHVLVKHGDAKRAEGIERSRGEACLRAQEAMAALKEGKSFEDVVAEFSDSEGAATTGGLIGEVKPGELGDDRLNEAAFALSVNQVSLVVESAFGFHIILRTR